MTSDQPLANLRRRLGAEPPAEPGFAPDGNEDDADAADPADGVPSWVPDGRQSGPRAWLAQIRADPGRAGGIALAAVAALAVLVTVFTLVRTRPAPVVAAKLPPVQTVPTAGPQTDPAVPSPVVSVVGLVNQPGLVTLAPDARIADAVSAAGGTLRGADTLGLNLARRVADGEQIVVGIATPAGQPAALGSSVRSGTPVPAAGPVAPAAPAGGTADPGVPTGPLDLNSATAAQLETLPGVGPVTAAAIVAWRQANGRFGSVDDLGEVDGIGPARLEKLRAMVRV